MASKAAGLATARKMAKKGGQASLQVDVSNDDEWNALLERQGLIVVDVYSEWCGPCVAMMSNLKKIKLDSGVDQFHLALANADAIKALNRFKGRSEPTWMIIAGGQIMRVLYGSNAPLLAKTIRKELEKEVKCMAGQGDRKGFSMDEITPDEQVKIDEMDVKKTKEADKEKKETAAALDKVKRRNYERIARVMNTQTIVIFFPPSIVEPEEPHGKRTCAASYKLMAKYDTAGLSIIDQLDVTLNREEVIEMMYNSGMVFPEELLKTIDSHACIASLVQEVATTPSTPAPQRHSVASKTSVHSGPSNLGLIEKKMATLVYGEKMDPNHPDPDSIYKMFETEINGVKVPPLWTPLEHISKSAAVNICFPTKVQGTNVPMDSLPPPSYIIIFEAKRAHEILDAAKPFAEDVLHVGYFDSAEPDKAVKIATTIYELEKLGEGKVNDTKMVLALKKTTSDPMLILAQMNPLYISSDLQSGTEEMEQFFPPTVDVIEEPDPWAPPPPEPKVYWTDEDYNVWVEENKVGYNGETILGRRLVQLADGTEVEDGEWREVLKEEPPAPEESEVEVAGEGGEGEEEEDIGLLHDDYGPMRKMQDPDEDTLIPSHRSSRELSVKPEEIKPEENQEKKEETKESVK